MNASGSLKNPLLNSSNVFSRESVVLLLVDQAINVYAKWSIPLLSQYCNKDTLTNEEEFKPTHSTKYHFYHTNSGDTLCISIQYTAQ